VEEDAKTIEMQDKELVDKGFIELVPGAEHPQVLSPAFLVSKADGGKRMVVDYSRVNKIVAPCALPLPKMDPLLDALARCRWKSKMDLTPGFYQVALTDEAKNLTAFVLPNGEVHRYNVLLMGLAVSPGVFQNYTGRHVRKFKQLRAAKELIDRGSVLEVLMNDFLLGSTSREDHLKLLALWLQYAEDEELFFKPSKCEFMCAELTVLGRRVKYKS
jgi:hypothetical protein